MKFFGLPLVAVAAVSLAACSSSKQDAGLTGSMTTDALEKNPYGKPYPTQNLGYQARKGVKGAAGNIIRNYKLQGYRHEDPSSTVDMSKGLETVALANFFDPEMRNYKVIHLSVAAVWCAPCNAETDATVQVAKDLLTQQKVVFVQAVDDGPLQGTGATHSDLDGWILKHKSNFTELLDPGLTNFGQFFDAGAVPWNANIDARSMEILSAGVGAPPDITADVTTWTKWVDTNPPQQAQ